MIKIGIKIAVLILALVIVLVYLSMKKEGFSKKDFLTVNPHTNAGIGVGVNIAGIEVSAEVADTPQKRAQGLSGRAHLGENEGMIFLFGDSAIRYFWMPDMNFALDIIWIDENKKIVDITKNALPESYPKRFSPTKPVKYVLEVNAGFADKNEIKIGDLVNFNY